MSTAPVPVPAQRPRRGGRSSLAASTGSHCPVSGTWVIRARKRSVAVSLPEGQLVPPALDSAKRWPTCMKPGARSKARGVTSAAAKMRLTKERELKK